MIPSGKRILRGEWFGKGEGMMTHIETTRVNELLGLQIGVVRDFSARLDARDLEQLDQDITELEGAIRELREMLASIPHHH
jgi:hypothetical protein